jgi:LacI family transcriptional regulator
MGRHAKKIPGKILDLSPLIHYNKNWKRSQKYSGILGKGANYQGRESLTNLTLEDIAKRCGVSRSTVSRVINNHPNVSDKVRKRVQKEIKNTGFRPHAAARALVSQRSWTIGLVLPRSVNSFFTDPYYPRLIQGIAQGCNQLKYTLGLYLLTDAEDEEEIFPRISRSGSLDGILFQSDQIGDQLIDRLAQSGIPMVIIGRPFHNDNISYIDIDNVTAAKTAMRHLISLKYRRIGTITGPLNTTVGIDRKNGYLQALQENGYPNNEKLIVEGDFTEDKGYAGMLKILPEKPDAVFVASDQMAIGAIRALREKGLRVPEDVAIIGFDDLPLSNSADLHLSTMHQPVSEFGVKAVEFLNDMIVNGTTPPRHIIMGAELVVRESCGTLIRNKE